MVQSRQVIGDCAALVSPSLHPLHSCHRWSLASFILAGKVHSRPPLLATGQWPGPPLTIIIWVPMICLKSTTVINSNQLCPTVNGHISANIQNFSIPPVGHLFSLMFRTMFVTGKSRNSGPPETRFLEGCKRGQRYSITIHELFN